MLFNLDFVYNTILSCFLILLCFLIPAVIAIIFNPAADLLTSLRIPTKELKAEIETHLVTPEAKLSNSSI